ncbi:glycerol-3-phosphate dehydrogenase subunit GlpB [Desulfovibrio sp. OttesenSCG-928-O18]|nr:glycerol-3-phosphate dehydrogenase subunit GlpB [Desulfovibrio sp. OttesenSCG-928-O18]
MTERVFPVPTDDLVSIPAAVHEEVMDLAVIGMGMAGLAAGVFAANRGMKTACIGSTGGLAYSTGYLDILGSAQSACGPYTTDPGTAFAELCRDDSNHPYARASWQEVGAVMTEFMDFLAEAGLPYIATGDNLMALSPIGTVKATYAVPATMVEGVNALRDRAPCLLVDFIGLKAFSAKGIAAALGEQWPDITPLTLAFPDLQWAGELYPEAMALALEVPATREALAASILPHIGNARYVGLPAILGIYHSAAAQEHLSKLLGVPVFEIPTLPPGLPGIRLRENLDEAMRGRGVNLFAQRYVFGVRKADGLFLVDIGETGPELTLRAKHVVLATGRFLSGGLVANRDTGISEPLFGLPVAAPSSREDWHREDLFDPAGHPVNRAGIRVDGEFRPLNGEGAVVDPALYAVGSIVAGQDWIREKSGAGISLVSAWKAVNAMTGRTREAV